MKKRLTAILLAIMMILLIVPLQALAATSGDYEYTDNGDGTCTITGYIGAGGDIVISSTLDGLTVIEIGDRVFCGSNITGITIPSSVIDIGLEALGSISLTQITVDINNAHFSSFEGMLFNKDVSKLIQYPCGKEDSYSIPDSVITIGDYAFSGSLISGVTIPSSVTDIGISAFSGCEQLISVDIPLNVEIIGENAFDGCLFLEVAYFYGNAPETGIDIFKDCASEFTVYFTEGQEGWSNPWNGHPAMIIEAENENIQNEPETNDVSILNRGC